MASAAVLRHHGVQRAGRVRQPAAAARAPLSERPVRAHRRLHVLYGRHRGHPRCRELSPQPQDIPSGVDYRC